MSRQIHLSPVYKHRGLFIEECKPNEKILPLTYKELFAYVIPTLNEITWTRIGYETGREWNAINFKADIKDIAILSLKNWVLNEYPPDKSYRKWAIEFFKEQKIDVDKYPDYLCRRYFWFQSNFKVPEE